MTASADWQLINKNNYEFEKNDILKIFSALEKELRSAKARFVQAEPKKCDIRKLLYVAIPEKPC